MAKFDRESKDIRIQQVEGGYMVDLNYRYRNRPENETAPEDHWFISNDLDKILTEVREFLTSRD